MILAVDQAEDEPIQTIFTAFVLAITKAFNLKSCRRTRRIFPDLGRSHHNDRSQLKAVKQGLWPSIYVLTFFSKIIGPQRLPHCAK
jgi:hypothetical protein